VTPLPTIDTAATAIVVLPLVCLCYAYIGYPLLLKGLSLLHGRRPRAEDPQTWPFITITVPAYNEVRTIATTLERLLALDYPAERRQIIVISDASTDGMDDVVLRFAECGIELLRQTVRQGKSAAENAVYPHTRGEIIVNIDATTIVWPASLKALIREFTDPTVGVASGRDVSVGSADESNQGESGYVGYEMWVRRLETQVYSIVGASGCFYGIRRHLYDPAFPLTLSRDFASAILAREAGYRAVSAEDAACGVLRTADLSSEFPRKVRTMKRGLQTLWYKRALLNPLLYGYFTFFLWSHKVARWAPYPLLIPSGVALIFLATRYGEAAALLAVSLIVLGLGIWGMRWPATSRPPKLVAIAGYAVAANVAGLLAWSQAVRSGRGSAIWEPTRRT